MSVNKIDKGKKGEAEARRFLESKGYRFLLANYRHKRAEVDLLMLDGECLVFVEVKTRKNAGYGFPEEFVSERKVELYYEAAEEYMHKNNWQGEVRFDVVAVLERDKKTVAIEHFKDAFS